MRLACEGELAQHEPASHFEEMGCSGTCVASVQNAGDVESLTAAVGSRRLVIDRRNSGSAGSVRVVVIHFGAAMLNVVHCSSPAIWSTT